MNGWHSVLTEYSFLLTMSMMRWPQTVHFSADCWKPEYCKQYQQQWQPTSCSMVSCPHAIWRILWRWL